MYFLYNKYIGMEQNSVNQRLNLLVETFENGVKAAFARKVGISTQGAQELLAGRKGAPSFKVLVKILESYPTVDANWLVLGRGEMLLSEAVELIDAEGASITPAEAKQLLHLQEVNAASNVKTSAELESMQLALSKLTNVIQSFVGEAIIPEKAQEIIKNNPDIFPSKAQH